MIKLSSKIKKFSFESFQKFILTTICNTVQNILKNIKKSSKNSQDQKLFLFVFVYYLSARVKIFFHNGEWTLDWVLMQFWYYPIISIFPKILRLKSFWKLVKQLVYQVCYTRYQVPLYLLWMESVLKLCKIPKYYEQHGKIIKVQWKCVLKHVA